MPPSSRVQPSVGRCLFIFELKTDKSTPEIAGQLGSYVAAIDDLVADPDDNPMIGILPCASKNENVVRYSLVGSSQPMAVATYELLRRSGLGCLSSAGVLHTADVGSSSNEYTSVTSPKTRVTAAGSPQLQPLVAPQLEQT